MMVVRLHRCDECGIIKSMLQLQKSIYQICEETGEGDWEDYYDCIPSPQPSSKQLELPPLSLLRYRMVDRR